VRRHRRCSHRHNLCASGRGVRHSRFSRPRDCIRPSEELGGRFVDTSRNGFRIALDISCYSLIALAKRARPLMPNGGSMVTMTYFGAEKVTPNYNVMGVAKAALEASVRYLAWDLGKDSIRVNAISAGPIKTLAASGVSGFRKSLNYVGQVAPMGNVDQERCRQAALFLLSDHATRITGEVLYVDGGYNIMGAPDPAVMNEHGKQDA
jgi:enoyl-[acyl-carrier protein] reductase I